MSMSRKHYRFIAQTLRETEMPKDARANIVAALSIVFKEDNPNFSQVRFTQAVSGHKEAL